MAGTPARLKVDIVADSRQARNELDGFSSKVAGFAAGVTASVTTFAIDKLAQGATLAAGALYDGVQAAASLSASLQTLQVNYGQAAGEIEKWAAGAAKGLGLSQLAAVQATNRFATYSRILGLGGKDAADFSTKLVKLSADLAAFNDKTTEEAIQAIGAAFRGERDPIEQFGVILNDAEVKLAYFNKTGEKVTGTLTTQQNIIGTLAALQEKGAVATDAFSREQEQLGNKSQVLNAQLENLKQAIGARLLPVFEDLVGVASTIVERFSDAGISGVWSRLAETWGGDLNGLRELVANWVEENVPDFRKWVSNASEWLLKVIYGDPENGIPSIFERFTQVVGAIDSASTDGKNTQSLNRSGSNVAEAFAGGFIDGIIRYISGTLPSAFGRIFSNPVTVADLVLPAFSLARSIGKAIADGILSFIQETLIKGLVDAIKGAIGYVLKLLGGAGGFLGGTLENIFGGFRAAGGPVFSNKAYVVGENGPELFVPNSAGQIIPNGYSGIYSPVNVTINATIPPGVNGQDVGAAIVSQLDDYYQRNGRFPWAT